MHDTGSGVPLKGLSIEGVGKDFGDFSALGSVDLDIREGEFLTLLGPSGSGKTTLLMTIAGFVPPTRGKIGLEGRDITFLPPNRRSFGMVFQGYALFPHLSVARNIAFPLRVRGLPAAEIKEKVDKALDLVQMSRFAERFPKQLSGGQQQRVALARALVFNPKVLLLDEPLSALDKSLRADLQWELKALHERVGMTFIYVTHDQEEALSMSDRIAIMRDGNIMQIGSPAELYERPGSRFIASFLGRSNFFPGVVTSNDGRCVKVRVGDQQFVAEGDAHPGESVVLSLRPEKISISTSQIDNMKNRVKAGVVGWNYYGSEYLVRVFSEEVSEEIIINTKVFGFGFEIKEGMTVYLGWEENQNRIVSDI